MVQGHCRLCLQTCRPTSEAPFPASFIGERPGVASPEAHPLCPLARRGWRTAPPLVTSAAAAATAASLEDEAPALLRCTMAADRASSHSRRSCWVLAARWYLHTRVWDAIVVLRTMLQKVPS